VVRAITSVHSHPLKYGCVAVHSNFKISKAAKPQQLRCKQQQDQHAPESSGVVRGLTLWLKTTGGGCKACAMPQCRMSSPCWCYAATCPTAEAGPFPSFKAEAGGSNVSCTSFTHCSIDAVMVSTYLAGARVLRQDPVECVFEFICSSNNHISRIHGMVDRLCRDFGSPLSTTDGENGSVGAPGLAFYAFPTLEQLSEATEEHLRAEGFGYRAKYITGSVAHLRGKPGGGAAWLHALREAPYPDAVASLCELPGVGPKVAACVALFSLDKAQAIPVDTHVWALACRYYTPHLKHKTLNKQIMEQVEAVFVERFGDYAGWAHNTLFIAELASQQEHLPAHLRYGKGSTEPKAKKQKASSSAELDAIVAAAIAAGKAQAALVKMESSAQADVTVGDQADAMVDVKPVVKMDSSDNPQPPTTPGPAGSNGGATGRKRGRRPAKTPSTAVAVAAASATDLGAAEVVLAHSAVPLSNAVESSASAETERASAAEVSGPPSGRAPGGGDPSGVSRAVEATSPRGTAVDVALEAVKLKAEAAANRTGRPSVASVAAAEAAAAAVIAAGMAKAGLAAVKAECAATAAAVVKTEAVTVTTEAEQPLTPPPRVRRRART